MPYNSFTYYKGRLSKWFLTITLFFSLFGYAGSCPLGHQQTFQTELFSDGNHKNNPSGISYKKGIVHAQEPNIFIRAGGYNLQTLLVYNKLVKVEFDNISKLFYSIPSTNQFAKVKIITASPDIESFNPITG